MQPADTIRRMLSYCARAVMEQDETKPSSEFPSAPKQKQEHENRAVHAVHSLKTWLKACRLYVQFSQEKRCTNGMQARVSDVGDFVYLALVLARATSTRNLLQQNQGITYLLKQLRERHSTYATHDRLLAFAKIKNGAKLLAEFRDDHRQSVIRDSRQLSWFHRYASFIPPKKCHSSPAWFLQASNLYME